MKIGLFHFGTTCGWLSRQGASFGFFRKIRIKSENSVKILMRHPFLHCYVNCIGFLLKQISQPCYSINTRGTLDEC